MYNYETLNMIECSLFSNTSKSSRQTTYFVFRLIGLLVVLIVRFNKSSDIIPTALYNSIMYF